jgi:plastocyanin
MNAKILTLAGALLAITAPLANAAELTVSQKNKSFEPGTLEAKVGDTVVFSNDDTVAHNVMGSGATKFNLGSVKPGAHTQTTLTDAGTVEVRCAIHPKMKLTIKVSQ